MPWRAYLGAVRRHDMFVAMVQKNLSFAFRSPELSSGSFGQRFETTVATVEDGAITQYRRLSPTDPDRVIAYRRLSDQNAKQWLDLDAWILRVPDDRLVEKLFVDAFTLFLGFGFEWWSIQTQPATGADRISGNPWSCTSILRTLSTTPDVSQSCHC